VTRAPSAVSNGARRRAIEPKPQIVTRASSSVYSRPVTGSACANAISLAQRCSRCAASETSMRRTEARIRARACSVTVSSCRDWPDEITTSGANPDASATSGPAERVWTQRSRVSRRAASATSLGGLAQVTSISASVCSSGTGSFIA
jgi:hypothetical protein